MHAVLLFALLIVATLSSIASVVAIGQYKLLSHTMCKNASSSGCHNETHSFDAKDQYAYVYFRIEMGETGRFGGSTVSWYYQSGSMEYSYTFDAYEVKKGETWWFYTWMSIRNDKADLRGFWHVDVIGPAGELLFTEQFTIGPFYQIRIDATGFPESVSIPIKVDGEDYGQIKEGVSKQLGFAPGTSHKLTVEKTTATVEAVRWYVQEDTWEFTGEGTHSFTYEEQYELGIEIDPAEAVTVTGAGWYPKGTAVNIQIPEVVNVDSGRQFVRRSITVNEQEVATPPTSITMDKPYTIRIQYQKQYYLKVISDYGNPQGEGWYDNGAKATFSVASPIPQAGVLGLLGGRMVFRAWTGDSSSTSVSASIWMNGPKTVTAEWSTDNTLVYVVIGAIVAVLIVALLLVRRRRKATPSPAHGSASVPSVAVHRFGGSGFFRRHFTIALLVLIVSTISVLGCQQAYAIPSSNMLQVPYHPQETDYYCGVASVQMAIHYISGDVIPQDTLAKELKTVPKEGTWTYMMHKPFDLRRYPAVHQAHATLDELKNQNSRGYVSVIVIWADTDHKYTHYVVVIGYNATGIFVNDPWPSNWGQPVSRRTGEKAFISNKLLSNLWAYLDEWVFEIPYESRIYVFTLSVTGVEDTYQSGPVALVIDGTEWGQIKSGELQSFYFKVETTHTVSVDEYVSGPEGTRYYAADNAITITSQDTHVIEYVEQHRLLVETITGTSEKWLAPDQTETLGPYDEIVPAVDSGTRYFFLGLVVDGVEQETTSVTLHMDQPHTVAVRYVTQYFLKVISDSGDPKGEDWYAPGDVATYSVTTPYGFLTQRVFVSWTGDITSAEPQGTLTMTRPYTIEAKWRDDYTQLFMVFVVGTAALIVPVFIMKRRKPQELAPPTVVQQEAFKYSIYADQETLDHMRSWIQGHRSSQQLWRWFHGPPFSFETPMLHPASDDKSCEDHQKQSHSVVDDSLIQTRGYREGQWKSEECQFEYVGNNVHSV
jgi:hypothetical protein